MNYSNTLFKYFLIPLLICSFCAAPLHASDNTLHELLKILRNKGTLTQEEYEELLTASEKTTSQRRDRTIKDTRMIGEKAPSTTKPASWTEKVKLKGDLRVRYQYDNLDNRQSDGVDSPDHRHRGRIRARIGVVAKPASNWEAGLGLTSGSNNPRGTNQDFGDSFSTKETNLDYAFIMRELGSISIIGGKFNRSRYLWNPTDLMWDSDIRPEGVSVHYASENRIGRFWTSSGLWVLDEAVNSEDDPFLFYQQIGQQFSASQISGRIAGTSYLYADLNETSRSRISEHSSGTNQDDHLSGIQLSGELKFRSGASQIGLMSDVVKNLETNSDENFAFSVGFKVLRAPWKFKYIYGKIEHDAIPDFLPDSDRFNGHTGIKGHEAELKYSLNKNTLLGLDFYSTSDYVTGIDQKVLQADVLLKF